MQINIPLLKEKISHNGMNIADFSTAIGINPSTFYRKIESGGEAFTVGQMHKTAEVLSLSGSEINDIFLFENSQ